MPARLARCGFVQALLSCAAALAPGPHLQAQGAAAVTPGEVVVEPPTLLSLGFEWYVEGDDDRDATVEVAFRERGSAEWRRALPLLRVHRERTVFAGALDYTAPNMFAGSVLDLEPDTEYEVRLALADPDGVHGAAERIVTARTCKEPEPYPGGRVFHVYPAGYQGPKEEPAFIGLLAAYYVAALGGDWSRASPPRVQPGDRIVVHAGVYKDDRTDYSHEIMSNYTTCCGTPWDGTYYLTQGGTAERPIAIVAAGDGEVVFDGDGNHVLFNVMGADHLYFEGITFRNTDTAIEAGQKGIAGAEGLTVKRSRFENVGVAIHSDWSGSRNFFIADNVMVGRNDPDSLFGWVPNSVWSARPDFDERKRLKSYYAVAVYGAGHVVAYNRISGFHDGIDHATYGMPDGYPSTPRDRMPVSIDFHNNDVSNVHDNCFEADGAMHNIRIFRNRCFNAATGAMSPQPIFGGPVYFFQNVVYNGIYGPLKVHGDPSGILVYQNTYVGEVAQLTPASNIHFRNNLIMGQGARPAVFAIDTYTNYSSSDYNGFRPNPGAEYAYQWSSPPFGVGADFVGRREQRRFATLADYVRATGQDRHSVELDYDVFRDAGPPDFSDPTRLVQPAAVDLRLRPGSAAVDAGTELPTITDGFSGRAPDLGAYELGREPPHYGPRHAD
ncbi:MAG TPA: hypothetical protein VF322_06050 [Gammaproteobacteria bacterium]